MTSKVTEWIAHTPPFLGGPYHLVRDHSTGVMDLAEKFGKPIGLGHEAWIAAALHDLGKYGALFQARLRKEAEHIDHWTLGAWVAYRDFRSPIAALAVQGHHIGLQSGVKPSLTELNPIKFEKGAGNPRQLSEKDPIVLLGRLASDGIVLPPYPTALPVLPTLANGMLRIRILFSVLTDADFIDTESHFARKDHGPKVRRKEGPPLDVDRALAAFDAYCEEKLKAHSSASVQKLRDEVSSACAAAADDEPGLFTLTAPTGSGKTLAMLRFALLHAKRHGLRRVIVVLPFLTLIEQTAGIYRDIFRDFGPDFVLEDHSLARDAEPKEDGAESSAKLLSENWDAPVVITTNVRFFEALHHNRPSVCRKLHRIAQSVVLCDEVQTLPLPLAPATLATLTSLSKDFKTTVVFATATQPAFPILADAVRELSPYPWAPREIMPEIAQLFRGSARVTVDWRMEPQSWDEIAEEIADQPGTLAIVNTRKDAANLAATLKRFRPDAEVLHLSTNMCVAHRRQVLDRVKANKIEKLGFLIATQCVEAGVDLDFLQVYRAWAPMDSIAQAAGRCNRNGLHPEPPRLSGGEGVGGEGEEREASVSGKSNGRVVVFLPEDAKYPKGGYEQAADIAKSVVKEWGAETAQLHDAALFQTYFADLYRARGAGKENEPLKLAIEAQNYVEVAKLYRLIPENGVNIVVRIGDALGADAREENEALLEELDKQRLSKKMMARLRPHMVNIFLPKNHGLSLSKLKDPRNEEVPDWFLMNNPAAYDDRLGLLTQEPPDAMIV